MFHRWQRRPAIGRLGRLRRALSTLAGSRGRFGLGAEDAHVVVRPLVAASPAATAEPATQEKAGRSAPRDQSDEDAYPAPLPFDHEAVGQAVQIVRDLLRLIDLDAGVASRPPETPGDGLGQASAVLDISGEDLGLLIGRRGETLQALQYMVNLLLNRGSQGRLTVTVDVEGYRRRREQRLVSMAKRAADDVDASGDTMVLEPMPAHERRLVHLALSEDSRVVTQSEGTGLNRRVIVSPSQA